MQRLYSHLMVDSFPSTLGRSAADPDATTSLAGINTVVVHRRMESTGETFTENKLIDAGEDARTPYHVETGMARTRHHECEGEIKNFYARSEELL